jgi:hypothetical protein
VGHVKVVRRERQHNRTTRLERHLLDDGVRHVLRYQSTGIEPKANERTERVDVGRYHRVMDSRLRTCSNSVWETRPIWLVRCLP